MEELLYWIESDCTVVPNEVVGDCITTIIEKLLSN